MAKPPPPSPCSPPLCRLLTTLPIPIIMALLQSLAVLHGHVQGQFIFDWCSGDTNYTATSQFKRNLDGLLTNLITVPATAARGYFLSASTGGPEAAYGLVQCRGDVLPAGCAACLHLTAKEVVALCPLRPVAAIRYDDCLLRYSDQPLLGVVEDSPVDIFWSTRNSSNLGMFTWKVMEMVGGIASTAATDSSRFAVDTKNYSEFGSVYGLAQCTRDLSQESCNRCLQDLYPLVPKANIGWRVSSVSCHLRLEVYQFFSVGGSTSDGKKKHASKLLVIVIIPVVSAVVFLFAAVICLKRRRSIKEVVNAEDELPIKSAESMSFSFGTLRTATGNFCDSNKLGQGGFGPVYKGLLPDGQQIAVKRLLRSSGQGLIELRNEVVLVAKLHHRNLVRLVGFCLEEAEKMVVYEYLPNTSLDKFLFDPNKRLQLDWERRYKLIEGISRGLVYLHEETRFRIIHRDLKASNILLDERMNPKISDFGFAKIFGVDETHGNTNRIAGTYGYMAPEYAMHGHFSIKSDVYSFGVLVLEIVTGRRNSGFQETENVTDLLSYVWYHWNEGAVLQLLDPSIVERSQEHEVLRCIHIGLLCVQEDPSERPNMSEVCLMLINSVMLPTPSRPAFLRGRVTRNYGVLLRGNDSTSSQDMEQRGVQSTNVVSISDLELR